MKKMLKTQIKEEICYLIGCRGLFFEEDKDATREQEKSWFTVNWSAYPQEEQSEVERWKHGVD